MALQHQDTGPGHGRLSGKCILIISPEPWQGLQMSKHHLARALAQRGNRVLWLDAPSRSFGPVGLLRDGPVERISYHHWLRGVNRLPRNVQRWYNTGLLQRMERAAGQAVDVVWSFDPSRMALFNKGDRLLVMHPVDLYAVMADPQIFRDADLSFTVSHTILAELQRMAPHVPALNLGHALAPQWTEGAWTPDLPKQHTRPLAVYAGNLSIKYLDWEVLHQEALRHPECNFRFMGPLDSEPADPFFRSIRRLPNVAFTGLLPVERLAAELRKADVLLLCYRADRWPGELANSHKLLEYLSTGKTVVASRTADHIGTDPMALPMAESRWEHPALLGRVLAQLSEYNAPDLQAKRRAIALEKDIHLQLQHMEKAIDRRWRRARW